MAKPISDINYERRVRDVRNAFAIYRRTAQIYAEHRLELGRALVAIRPTWPQSGPKAKPWGDFLRAEGIDEDVALDAMKYAGYVDDLPGVPGELPTRAEAGVDPVSPTSPDRDTWCSPKWITDAIGMWELDPCSNARSTVQSRRACRLDRNQDGLVFAADVKATERVFVNPPYSDVMPWVHAYKHTRFCFLVKFDPSTKWCEELLAHTELVLFPRRTRVEFVPPEGINASSNPFPHGLFYARAKDATAEIRALCYEWRVRAA